MPRGGHSKSGPVIQDAQARALRGSRERPQHRTKGDLGQPMIACDAPPGMSPAERKFWDYYAPQLVASRRLPLKARDALAKYCSALAVVADLRRRIFSSRSKADIANRTQNRKELRQWVLAARLYENDLLLNPSSLVRVAKPEGGGGSGGGELNDEDPFDEFDDTNGVQ